MVYQYVGDEAVLTWESAKAMENANCVRLFFAFVRQLRSREDYYQKTYGVSPSFKAGINVGPVMAAEVGVVKREIAYHSDVLNTAARIQEQCNQKNASLLISENMLNHLPEYHGYEVIDQGAVMLRGKGQQVSIYEIREWSPSLR